MDQVVANKLRPLLHAAIADAVDWDRLGLSRGFFVGKSQKASPDYQYRLRPTDDSRAPRLRNCPH